MKDFYWQKEEGTNKEQIISGKVTFLQGKTGGLSGSSSPVVDDHSSADQDIPD